MKKKTNTKKNTQKTTHQDTNQVCNRVDLTSPSRFIEDGERVRSVSLELYAPPVHWGKLLSSATNYAYILHDKDVKEDGTPKPPHYHVLLHFPNAKTKSAIRKLTELDKLDSDTTMLSEKLDNPHGAFKYLTHDTKKAVDDKKHKYDESEIVTNDLLYWLESAKDETKPHQEFLDDLLNDEFSHYNLACKYGRDYMKNYRSYSDFAREVKANDHEKNVAELRREVLDNLASCDNADIDDTYSILVDYIAEHILVEYNNSRGSTRSSSLLKLTADDYLDRLSKSVLFKLTERKN